jgi:hypothetical protein
MTSNRPYRTGLPTDVALAEIEAGAGAQFHPAVAKAFVALERGIDPFTVLTPAEIAGLKRLSLSRGSGLRRLAQWADARPNVLASVALAGALAAVGFGKPWLALSALLGAAAILIWLQVERSRARLLTSSLHQVLADAPAETVFGEMADRLARVSPLRWAGLVAWHERDLAGSVETEWGDRVARPAETALTSWLIREAEMADEVAGAPGSDLGTTGRALAVPLRRDGSTAGYVVLVFDPQLPRHVELALRGCADDLAHVLVLPPPPVASGRARRLAAVG